MWPLSLSEQPTAHNGRVPDTDSISACHVTVRAREEHGKSPRASRPVAGTELPWWQEQGGELADPAVLCISVPERDSHGEQSICAEAAILGPVETLGV